MNTLVLENKRLVWVDWMKVLGMYFIIVGHMFPKGYEYVYTFSVPLFFFVSGFLSKKEKDVHVFWKKLFCNLVVPMICFSIIFFLWTQVPPMLHGNWNLEVFWRFPINLIVGNQGEDFGGVGLVAMWFVYTLCVLKITLQYVPEKEQAVFYAFVLALCVSGNVELYHAGFKYFNSWVNTITAILFFYIGYLLMDYKEKIAGKSINSIQVFLGICTVILVFLCGKYNDTVFMYQASYGSNYCLFLIGSFAGIYTIYIVSRSLGTIGKDTVGLLGGGTIVILGLHNILIKVFKMMGAIHLHIVLDYLIALLILLAFIPIIIFVKKYLPFLYGAYRK